VSKPEETDYSEKCVVRGWGCFVNGFKRKIDMTEECGCRN